MLVECTEVKERALVVFTELKTVNGIIMISTFSKMYFISQVIRTAESCSTWQLITCQLTDW